MRTVRIALVAALLCSGVVESAQAAGPPLGKKAGFGPYSTGWGKPHPGRIYNGGVPSGIAYKLSWSNWGGRVAYGRGWSPQYKPGGGYYRKAVRIQLRAVDLGKCGADSATRYRRLLARKQLRPNGPWEPWRAWAVNLCSPFAELPEYASCSLTYEDSQYETIAERFQYTGLKCAEAQKIARANPWPDFTYEAKHYTDRAYDYGDYECSGFAAPRFDSAGEETGDSEASWTCVNPRTGAYLQYRQW